MIQPYLNAHPSIQVQKLACMMDVNLCRFFSKLSSVFHFLDLDCYYLQSQPSKVDHQMFQLLSRIC